MHTQEKNTCPSLYIHKSSHLNSAIHRQKPFFYVVPVSWLNGPQAAVLKIILCERKVLWHSLHLLCRLGDRIHIRDSHLDSTQYWSIGQIIGWNLVNSRSSLIRGPKDFPYKTEIRASDFHSYWSGLFQSLWWGCVSFKHNLFCCWSSETS